MCAFGVLGLSYDSPRTPNVHISGNKKSENGGGRGKKKARNFGAPTFRAPTLRGPHPLAHNTSAVTSHLYHVVCFSASLLCLRYFLFIKM